MTNLAQLATMIGAELRGDGSKEIRGCAGLEEASGDEVSFLANPRYASRLAETGAGAVILAERFVEYAGHRDLLVAANPYFSFREAMVALHGFRLEPEPGVSDRASIHSSAEIGADCAIQDFVYVAEEAVIGPGCHLYPHCYVGPRARLGAGTILYPGVVVYDDCVLGERVVLHAGCVVGNDGFGFVPHEGGNHKIPQTGIVVIEDDVEMGANCVIDRATLGETRVGEGTKTANLVVIGHGARVGRYNLYSAQSGVAGSVRVGDYVMMGGQAGIRNHIRVGSRSGIAARAAVMEDLPPGSRVKGDPARSMREETRLTRHLERLPDLVRRFEELEARLSRLEGAPAALDE